MVKVWMAGSCRTSLRRRIVIDDWFDGRLPACRVAGTACCWNRAGEESRKRESASLVLAERGCGHLAAVRRAPVRVVSEIRGAMLGAPQDRQLSTKRCRRTGVGACRSCWFRRSVVPSFRRHVVPASSFLGNGYGSNPGWQVLHVASFLVDDVGRIMFGGSILLEALVRAVVAGWRFAVKTVDRCLCPDRVGLT